MKFVTQRGSARLQRVFLAILALMTSLSAGAQTLPKSPAELYGELFERAQMQRVYADSKAFVDLVANVPPEQLMAEYRRDSQAPDFDLKKFIREHFTAYQPDANTFRTQPGEDVRTHIDRLWSVLERKPDDHRAYSSRLPLPDKYIVPGGRFNEIYYWDSYFTMLGLEESGRIDLIRSMVHNFAHLIDTYGHIPNGNRSYYLSRSQPPFFAAMVELLATKDGDGVYQRYLPQLKREHSFWMEGAQVLKAGAAHRRVVKLADGSVLNRHWDDRTTPREESYREDVATAKESKRPDTEVYRDLRASAESGWDFSSRWLADGRMLSTIHTTDFTPPELNSLLYQLERTIAHGCELARDSACARDMQARAEARKSAMTRYLWNAKLNAFTDYDWRTKQLSDRLSAATFYPLYFRVATDEQAKGIAATTRDRLLQPHGIATTLVRTGEQWDSPNGWAPLQWIAISGLRNYGEMELAETAARRWIAANLDVFDRTGKLVEKYDVTDAGEHAKGGEYPLQDGFGWTNGVLRKLLVMYPAKPASQ
jgi:alpha,alpha-trehalase